MQYAKNPGGLTYKPSEMAGAILNIPSGGSGWTSDGLATNTEPNGAIVLGSSVTEVQPNAFYNRPIMSVSGQNVTKVGSNAFYGCSITEIKATDFPSLVTVGGSSFAGNVSLQKAFFPLPKGFDSYALDGCSNLETVVAPNAHTTGRYLCRNCTKLKAFDMRGDHTAATRVNDHSFINDSVFDTFVYGGNRLPLLDLNAFDGTPFASNGTGGTIYVRADMIASFQASTNWATLIGYANNQIKSIESTHTDPTAPIDLTTHYVDGTVIS